MSNYVKTERDEKAYAAAQRAGLSLVWQHSCHEALLLRHLEGCESLRPATSRDAIARLQQHWPQYVKGMPALRLRDRITFQSLRRACSVEPDLAAVLRQMGFNL